MLNNTTGEVKASVPSELMAQVFARKLVRPFGEVTREDVLNEARAIDKLQARGKSANLVWVTEHGWHPESSYYYIDMELCEGNLDNYIKGKENCTYELSDNPRLLGTFFTERGIWYTWDIMEQIASGIEFIHACGQVHRDLKPRNGKSKSLWRMTFLVLFSALSKTWKVGDFGLTAEGTSKRAHATRYARGTPCYRAPELLRERAEYSNKVDIFAMGCILFELATGGRKAFADDINAYEFYSSHSALKFPFEFVSTTETANFQFSPAIRAMLNKDSLERPSAGG